MPYALDIPRHLPGCLNWSDLPGTPKDSAAPTRLRREPAKLLPPIPFIQEHYEEDLKRFPVPRTLPDIFQGRWSGSFFVSERFRRVVSDMEAVEHHFQPVDLTMLDGTRFPTGYFALGIADFVVAIDAENSEVKAKFFDGKKFYYLATDNSQNTGMRDKSFSGDFFGYVGERGQPFIQWKEEQLDGRHLWVDKHYPSEAFISDALARAFKREGITGLSLRPSAITGGSERSSRGYLQRLGKRLRHLQSRRYDALEDH